MSTSNSPNEHASAERSSPKLALPTSPKLALIAGPTASGKSDLAVRLARSVPHAVVINADSAQVYSDLSVLSARPTADEMQGVPHRLFGAWDGAQACSAADWAAAARAEIDAAHDAGALPILVGGTGLYIRTLLDGIAPIPPIDPAIRSQVRALPVAAAYAALTSEDPARAAQLAPADTTRIARALEVVRSTRAPMAHWHARRNGGIGDRVDLSAIVLMPDRTWLYDRCDRRFAAMWQRGAVDEVRALLARRLDPDLPVMRAIGVREIAGMLNGEIDEPAAMASGSQATRNYAKRQYTWLRNQTPPQWPRVATENYIDDDKIASLFQL